MRVSFDTDFLELATLVEEPAADQPGVDEPRVNESRAAGENSQTDPPAGAVGAEGLSLAAVVDLLLKDLRRLDALLADPLAQRALIPRLLAVALASFAVYGFVTTFLLNALHASRGFWLAGAPAAFWPRPTVANLTLAYSLGLIAANGVCLPSFYFYGLLGGAPMTMVGVTAHALKGMAAGGVALLGIVPVYFALALSAIIFPLPQSTMALMTLAGLSLPFIAGLWGAACLYQGFVRHAARTACGANNRLCMLRRLLMAWSGCYLMVTPLMIYTLWDALSAAMNGGL